MHYHCEVVIPDLEEFAYRGDDDYNRNEIEAAVEDVMEHFYSDAADDGDHIYARLWDYYGIHEGWAEASKKPDPVCRLDRVPRELTCFTFIAANRELEPARLWQKDVYNGVSLQSTGWDGNFHYALIQWRTYALRVYKHEYHGKFHPDNDWLAVTLDYHN